MSAYPRVPLGEVCTINPRIKRSGIPEEDTLVSFVPMAAVDERFGMIAAREDRRLGDVSKGFTVFEDGDVLFAKITPCMENGKAALARNLTNGIGRGSTEFYVLRPGSKVLGGYVYHFVRQPRFREKAKRHFTGTAGQQRVPKSFMEDVPIPLPPLDEQRRIICILNRASRIEHLHARAAARLREFVPALFIKMFGDPIENSMEWKTTLLGNLILKGPQNGLYRPKSDYGSGTRILRIDGFYDGYVTNPLIWQRVRIDDNILRKYALAEDDIVINRVNSRPFLGKCAIVPNISEAAVFESNMMRLTVNSDLILPKLLNSLLQIESVRQRLHMNAKDAINQSSINQSDVCGIPIIVPPIALQNQFVAIITAVQRATPVTETASNTASALSASLISNMLSLRS